MKKIELTEKEIKAILEFVDKYKPSYKYDDDFYRAVAKLEVSIDKIKGMQNVQR